MKRHHAGVNVWLFGLSASLLALTACGARSSLEVGRGNTDTGGGGSSIDAGPDADDAGPDVPPSNCEEAGVTFIYIMTQENDLFRFYPPDLSFTFIGPIQCPAKPSFSPFSMAVDRKGTGYVLFNDGELFTVSTANASCKSTSFLPDQGGFSTTFGMGFSANTNGREEQLFVAGTGSGRQLATIDTVSMDLTIVGKFPSSVGNLELTGTGDARLFGFGHDPGVTSFHLIEIDKSDASIFSDLPVPAGQSDSAWAFAFWGGDFYFFTSQNVGVSDVTRFRPDDGSFKAVAQLDRTIVGAGVSTCAPE